MALWVTGQCHLGRGAGFATWLCGGDTGWGRPNGPRQWRFGCGGASGGGSGGGPAGERTSEVAATKRARQRQGAAPTGSFVGLLLTRVARRSLPGSGCSPSSPRSTKKPLTARAPFLTDRWPSTSMAGDVVGLDRRELDVRRERLGDRDLDEFTTGQLADDARLDAVLLELTVLGLQRVADASGDVEGDRRDDDACRYARPRSSR